jgi:hypothetical protein
MPTVFFFVSLDLEQKPLFMDEDYLARALPANNPPRADKPMFTVLPSKKRFGTFSSVRTPLRNIRYMPAVIFLRALILNRSPHLLMAARQG